MRLYYKKSDFVNPCGVYLGVVIAAWFEGRSYSVKVNGGYKRVPYERDLDKSSPYKQLHCRVKRRRKKKEIGKAVYLVKDLFTGDVNDHGNQCMDKVSRKRAKKLYECFQNGGIEGVKDLVSKEYDDMVENPQNYVKPQWVKRQFRHKFQSLK